MEIYLIRHGIAHPLGQKNEFTDEKRTLTPQGRERMREVARGLRRLGIKLDLIMSSTLARAEETANIVAEAMGIDEKLIVKTANLAPGARISDITSEIKQQNVPRSVALVGHEPLLGYLAGALACRDSHSSIPLKKGGACFIEVVETVPEFRGNLVWLATPRQLRLIGKV
ncbi:MAG: phosphohistidine phosphatase SixA [Blastocatellia bacterium]